MKQLWISAVNCGVLVLWGACCTTQQCGNIEKEVVATVEDIYRVAQAGDVKALEGYHLYGPKFSRLDHDGTLLSAEETNKGESEFFSLKDNQFQYKVLDPKVSVLSNSISVVTYYLQYSAKMGHQMMSSKDAVTFVMMKDKGKWKIAHENFKYLPGYPKMKKIGK